MNKFKVGAKVRHKRHPQFGIGVIRTAEGDTLASGSVTIQFENQTGSTCRFCKDAGIPQGYGWSTNIAYVGNLEFLDNEVPQIGDRVRILNTPITRDFYDHRFNGKEGTVLREMEHDTVDVKIDGLQFCQYVPLTDLVKVPLKLEPVAAVKSVPSISRRFQPEGQCARILGALMDGEEITPLKAFGTMGVYRLAARIHELRSAGYKIKSTIKEDRTGKTYASYRLTLKGKAA